MADQIQIPQRNPQYVAPVAPPTDLIQALYNRPKPGEIAASALGQGVMGVLDQYYKQKQLQAGAFEAGGPYLMNLLYGRGQQPPQQPQPGQQSSLQHPTAGTPGGMVAGENAPQSPATPQNASPSASTANIGQDQPLSEAIQASVKMGAPDFTGHLTRIKQKQGEMDQSNQLFGASAYGLKNQQMLTGQIAAEKAAMDAEQLPVDYQKKQFEQSQQPTIDATNKQTLLNAQRQIPDWIAGKTAEMQGKYGEQDIKTQQGIKALQDFSDSWDQVGSNLKGPKAGGLTSKAGSLFSGVAPDVTTFNKIRENTATALATALLPENARANPLMVKELADTLPSLQSSPQEKQRVLANFASQLQNNASLNYKNNQAQAQAVGGSIKKTEMPTFKQQGTSEIHNAALEWARANPKDPRAKAVLSKARASLQGNQ